MAFIFVSGLIVTLFLRRTSDPENHEYNEEQAAVSSSKTNKIRKSGSSQSSRDSNLDDQPNRIQGAVASRSQIDQQLDLDEEEFTKVESLWGRIMQEKFKKLGLSNDSYQKYQSMREDFEQEALAEFENFHQSMQENRGKDYKYRLTEFDDQVMNKLRKEYNEKLAQVIGEEATREIVKTRDEFNEKLKRGTKNALDDVIIDF